MSGLVFYISQAQMKSCEKCSSMFDGDKIRQSDNLKEKHDDPDITELQKHVRLQFIVLMLYFLFINHLLKLICCYYFMTYLLFFFFLKNIKDIIEFLLGACLKFDFISMLHF